MSGEEEREETMSLNELKLKKNGGNNDKTKKPRYFQKEDKSQSSDSEKTAISK